MRFSSAAFLMVNGSWRTSWFPHRGFDRASENDCSTNFLRLLRRTAPKLFFLRFVRPMWPPGVSMKVVDSPRTAAACGITWNQLKTQFFIKYFLRSGSSSGQKAVSFCKTLFSQGGLKPDFLCDSLGAHTAVKSQHREVCLMQ